MIDANGESHKCSRRENTNLFKLVVGGYGLFGLVYSARLRLVPRQKVRRVVSWLDAAELPDAFEHRIRDGFVYGDFQFAIDSGSADFVSRGILSCYQPLSDDTPVPSQQRHLSASDWQELIYLAHSEPGHAFEKYTQHYLSTSGQIYLSDTQYVSDYFDDYHHELDMRLGTSVPASEVLGELFVPREALPGFLVEARNALRRNNSTVIYGTIRLIEEDSESFLAWAKQPYAGVIFNLHTRHTPQDRARTASAFRQLINLAIQYQGSFYLTYHRYATREQVLACYPEFPEFLRLKLALDPYERFQSDWYNHYKKLFA